MSEVIELYDDYWEYDVNMVPFTQFESGEGKINGDAWYILQPAYCLK